MLHRSLAVFATATAALLVLAGCSSPSETPAQTPEDGASANQECLLDAQPGPNSAAVTVAGSGQDLAVTVPTGLTFENIERTVIKTGSGEDIHVGDFVSVEYQILNGETGELLDSSLRGEDGMVSVLLDMQNSSLFTAALECAPLGSETVLVLPGQAIGSDNTLVVYARTGELLPTVAAGTPVPAVEGMPTVALDATGAPTITIPEGALPDATSIELLKRGDGPVVKEGDFVTLQYFGVRWSDGQEFDSTWSRGAPTQLATTQVVPGFQKALEGQTVGSQVLAVITPADGYAGSGNELADETLVFVIDILGAATFE